VARRRFDAFDIAATLFVVAVALHAGSLLARGVGAGHERLAIVWLSSTRARSAWRSTSDRPFGRQPAGVASGGTADLRCLPSA
jgi:hypothetical protein